MALPKGNGGLRDRRWRYTDEHSELSTALRYELPVLVLNLNNRYLGMVKQWRGYDLFGRHSRSYMQSLPDFVRFGGSIWPCRAADWHQDELESKLSEALEHVRNNRLVFVDVTVDGSEHVYPMQIRGAGWTKVMVKQNGEDLMMRRILSVLLEKSGALSRVIVLFS